MSSLSIAGLSFRNLPRRRFTIKFKHKVVEYLLRSGSTVADVARIYDVHPNQLCRWRAEYRKQMGSSDDGDTVAFLPVNLTACPEPTLSIDSGLPSKQHNSHGPCLTIAVSKGNIRVMPGCPTELLRIAIEALQ